MPVNYQYTHVVTKQPVILNIIDKLICDMHGEPCDKKKYHPAFQFLMWMGTAILSYGDRHGIGNGFETNKESVEAFIADPQRGGDLYDGEANLMRHFFYKVYTYKAWR